MFVSVLMTHFYDVNELDIIIRRSNKSRLFEDSAQKATGEKSLSGSEPEAGICKLSAIRTP